MARIIGEHAKVERTILSKAKIRWYLYFFYISIFYLFFHIGRTL